MSESLLEEIFCFVQSDASVYKLKNAPSTFVNKKRRKVKECEFMNASLHIA